MAYINNSVKGLPKRIGIVILMWSLLGKSV